MSISPETIEQVRLATDIVELVREYVPSLKKSGRNWKANCPFHHEKTPSFMVNGEKGIFHCFGCSAGGDVFKFVMQMDHLTWPEAVKKLASRAGITIRESREELLQRSEKQKIYDLLQQAASFYHRCLAEAKEGAEARRYLAKRGVTDETIEKFQVGFAPQGALIVSATKKGFSYEQLGAAGLITKTERGRYFEYMSGRVVFPILDSQGRVVAFGGRTLKDEQPKYLNTPETAVYSKSQHLYGLFQAAPLLRQKREIIILEGYMDVVVTHQFGVANTVATLGTAFTPQHAHVIARYAEDVTLLFDSDNAGINATRRAIEVLIETDLSLYVAQLPDGVDPDEYLLKEGLERFQAWLAADRSSAIAFLAEQAIRLYGTDTPEKKARTVAEVIPLMAKVKNAVLRREWVRYLAGTVGTTEDALLAELRRFGKTPAPKKEAPQSAPVRGVVVRDAEEEILQIIAACPQCRGMIAETVFRNERNRRIYTLLKEDVPVAEIVNRLEEKEAAWFTELVFEEKNYAKPEQTVESLLRDIKHRDMEAQRQKLEKEVIMMLNGQIPSDDRKIQLYQDLTKQLKGSVRE